jgi:hypothetical protein
LALNIVGSFVNGLMPFRAFVAGFLMTTNFACGHMTLCPESRRAEHATVECKSNDR